MVRLYVSSSFHMSLNNFLAWVYPRACDKIMLICNQNINKAVCGYTIYFQSVNIMCAPRKYL